MKNKPESSKIHLCLFQFRIDFTYKQDFSWQITRSYSDFMELNSNLHRSMLSGSILSVPSLPSDIDFKNSPAENQLEGLTVYLIELVEQNDICNNANFLEFLEVSVLSFNDTTKKRKEGYVNKRTGGRIGNDQKCFYCSKHCKRLQRRWLIVKDNMVGYLTNHMKGSLHEVLIFKGKFEVLKGQIDTGYSDGILIITHKRKFYFRAGSEQKLEEWYQEIQNAKQESE